MCMNAACASVKSMLYSLTKEPELEAGMDKQLSGKVHIPHGINKFNEFCWFAGESQSGL